MSDLTGRRLQEGRASNYGNFWQMTGSRLFISWPLAVVVIIDISVFAPALTSSQPYLSVVTAMVPTPQWRHEMLMTSCFLPGKWSQLETGFELVWNEEKPVLDSTRVCVSNVFGSHYHKHVCGPSMVTPSDPGCGLVSASRVGWLLMLSVSANDCNGGDVILDVAWRYTWLGSNKLDMFYE